MAVPVALKQAVAVIDCFGVVVRQGACREGGIQTRALWLDEGHDQGALSRPLPAAIKRQFESNVTENAQSSTKVRASAADAVMYVAGVGFFRSGCGEGGMCFFVV